MPLHANFQASASRMSPAHIRNNVETGQEPPLPAPAVDGSTSSLTSSPE